MWSHNKVPDTCQVWNSGGYHQQLKKVIGNGSLPGLQLLMRLGGKKKTGHI